MKSKSESSAPAITYIAESTLVNADIECKHDLRISGTIEGETKTHKKLILTGSGKIKGTIHSPTADISGKVIGDVRAAEKLTLRSSAIIEGRIFTKKLSIEDGAQIKGSLQVGPEVDTGKNSTQISKIPSSPNQKKSGNDKPDDSTEEVTEKTSSGSSKRAG